MVLFPPCKINLGLQVIRKRSDGYHEIRTVFYPAGWCDVLELIPGDHAPFSLTLSGIPVNGPVEKNLCYKAWQLLSNDFKLPGLNAHLHKVIPMGAGLGGGSSDGAYMLKLVNAVCKLNLSAGQLRGYASQLGSDCPFFIEPQPVLASGRGEILEFIDLDLTGLHVLIVMPGVTVNTAEAYSMIEPHEPAADLKKIIKLSTDNWPEMLVNDFQKPVSDRHTVIKDYIAAMKAHGAVYTAMSGSGAAVYGIFNSPPAKTWFPGVKSWSGPLNR